jgi:hypothetical protein
MLYKSMKMTCHVARNTALQMSRYGLLKLETVPYSSHVFWKAISERRYPNVPREVLDVWLRLRFVEDEPLTLAFVLLTSIVCS